MDKKKFKVIRIDTLEYKKNRLTSIGYSVDLDDLSVKGKRIDLTTTNKEKQMIEEGDTVSFHIAFWDTLYHGEDCKPLYRSGEYLMKAVSVIKHCEHFGFENTYLPREEWTIAITSIGVSEPFCDSDMFSETFTKLKWTRLSLKDFCK